MTMDSGGDEGLALAAFEAQRPRLTGIAYRLLGSVDDVQDVVQAAWLRWAVVPGSEVRSAEALLTTIVTRLSVDRRVTMFLQGSTTVAAGGTQGRQPQPLNLSQPGASSRIGSGAIRRFS
jgi:hypothetical protein